MNRTVITIWLMLTSGLTQLVGVNSASPSRTLSQEQVSVYHAALLGMLSYGPYDLVDSTGELKPDEGDYAACMKGFPSPPPIQHSRHLDETFAKSNHMALIGSQQAMDHPLSGFAGIERYTPPDKPPAPDKSNCRVYLSEIIFDAHHRRAALNVTVSCPGGGHSETHVYRLHRGQWLLSKDCGSGIS